MIARQGEPLFFGPVQPSGTQFTRLIASLQQGNASSSAVSAHAGPLLQRLAAHSLPK